MKRKLFPILVAVVLCLSTSMYLACVNNTPPGDAGSKTGDKAGAGKGETAKTEAAEVKHIVGEGDFKTEVLDYDGVVLVEFTAGWCPPCQRLSPHIDKLAGEMAGKLKVVKVYEDEEGKPNTGLLRQYKVGAFPTMVIFNKGEEVARKVSYQDYNPLKSWVSKYI